MGVKQTRKQEFIVHWLQRAEYMQDQPSWFPDMPLPVLSPHKAWQHFLLFIWDVTLNHSNKSSICLGKQCHRSVVSDSMQPHGSSARFLCPWDSPGKNIGVGCHSLLQGIFPTPGIELRSPVSQVNSLLSELPGKHLHLLKLKKRCAIQN